MNVWTTGGGDPYNTDAASWDGPTGGATTISSGKPAVLTTGTNAVWIGTSGNVASERVNARFVCTGNVSTPANIRTQVYNFANWSGDGSPAPATPTFTLPTNCNYANALLPVNLVKFTVVNMLSNVSLIWQADNEINFSHYEIERSFNGTVFFKAGTVAANNYAGTSFYAYTDNDALKNNAAVIYFRLKMVDMDGTFKYSPIATIKNKRNAAFVVGNMINPVKDKISFNVSARSGGKLELQLTDMNGRILLTKAYNITGGNSELSLNETATLATGIYMLRLNFGDNLETFKIVKQ